MESVMTRDELKSIIKECYIEIKNDEQSIDEAFNIASVKRVLLNICKKIKEAIEKLLDKIKEKLAIVKAHLKNISKFGVHEANRIKEANNELVRIEKQGNSLLLDMDQISKKINNYDSETDQDQSQQIKDHFNKELEKKQKEVEELDKKYAIINSSLPSGATTTRVYTTDIEKDVKNKGKFGKDDYLIRHGELFEKDKDDKDGNYVSYGRKAQPDRKRTNSYKNRTTWKS